MANVDFSTLHLIKSILHRGFLAAVHVALKKPINNQVMCHSNKTYWLQFQWYGT